MSRKSGKLEGEVVWYNPEKAYGFIKSESLERDIFVHATALEESGINTLTKGDAVTFFVATGRNGKPMAVEITVTGEG